MMKKNIRIKYKNAKKYREKIINKKLTHLIYTKNLIKNININQKLTKILENYLKRIKLN